MNIGIQITATLSIVSEPFLPFTSAKLKDALSIKNINWNDSGKEIIRKNSKINLINPLINLKISSSILLKMFLKVKMIQILACPFNLKTKLMEYKIKLMTLIAFCVAVELLKGELSS